jgi:hypothetical protein
MNKEYMQRIAGIKSVGQLNESIGGYVDLKPFNHINELEKPEKIYADDQDDFIDTDRMMEVGGEQVEQGIMTLIQDGFNPEDVLDMCKMFIEGHSDTQLSQTDMEESFDKDMSDIALDYSNNNPNTPPGAKAGELPKQNEEEDPDDNDDDSVGPIAIKKVKKKEHDWSIYDDDDSVGPIAVKEKEYASNSVINKMQLNDLREKDGLYYVGDIFDIDGSPWVDKKMALQILDIVNNKDVKEDASGEADEELTPSGEFDWDV